MKTLKSEALSSFREITTTMSESDLPWDLIEEILCRVPASSLKRLRSTCKRWNSLFNDGRFTRKHFHKASKQFLILMWKDFRLCTMNVDLQGIPSAELTGELSLIDPHKSCLDQFEIFQTSYFDGLLLCTNEDSTRVVVWNPCTGQTKWIQLRDSSKKFGTFTFGSYQGGNNSYKILCIWGSRENDQEYVPKEFEIYESNSNSWRILEGTLDCKLGKYDVSLKGKTYWFGYDENEEQLGQFLVSFDYTTERFGRLPFPCHCTRYETVTLSVVREEKLSVLIQREVTSRTEIWVTNKIGESNVVSWSMVLALDLYPKLEYWHSVSFLVDEEKKVIVCCHGYKENDEFGEVNDKSSVYIVGEDKKVRKVDLVGGGSYWPFLLTYVPSLTQIQ